jgi:hypothetical protein
MGVRHLVNRSVILCHEERRITDVLALVYHRHGHELVVHWLDARGLFWVGQSTGISPWDFGLRAWVCLAFPVPVVDGRRGAKLTRASERSQSMVFAHHLHCFG